MTVETSIGKITASREVLNEISLAFGYCADAHNSKGHKASAERASDIAYEIFVALDKVNYYTD